MRRKIPDWVTPLAWVSLFSMAFGCVEAAVVVYLRDLYYPQGFTLPLRPSMLAHLRVELVREAATLVMLMSVGLLAGRTRWQRISFFMIGFGAWDIFFYMWLKVFLGWPSSVFDWDVLFLLPLPWIGPVIAPLLISLLLMTTGVLLLRKEAHSGFIRIPPVAWVLGIAATSLILYSFMRDTDATLHAAAPQPYWYELLAAGLGLYIPGIFFALRGTASTT